MMERFPCECGDHVWATMTKGYVLLVSPCDEGLLDQNWTVSTSRKRYNCAHRAPRKGERRQSFKLHREIMQPPAGMVVDHINLNALDNRRANMRLCTPQQNMLNRRPYPGKAVAYKGVQRTKDGKYKVVIRFMNELHYAGHNFETAEEAYAAYLEKARALHGEFFRAS